MLRIKSSVISEHLRALGIPSDINGMDCGPQSENLSNQELNGYFWNGPPGVFEFENFSKGTKSFLDSVVAVTKAGGSGIIGGDDSDTAARCSAQQ